MFDVKDPAIKLFGKTIPLPESQMLIESEEKSDQTSMITMDSEDKAASRETTKTDIDDSPNEEPCKEDKSSTLNNGDTHQTPTTVQNKPAIDSNLTEDRDEADTSGQEKVLKKPDKVLPCPRCNSLDTKFCYYNNYNVNQPRHFCKNCQRYWTAGGTMRNVPVGAGRRKTKHTASQYRQIMMSSEEMPSNQVDTSDSANHQVLWSASLSAPSRPNNGNETVLKFGLGPDVPLCESMATVLNLGEKKRKVEMGAMVCGENGEEPSSCESSATASTCHENKIPKNVAQMEPLGLPDCFNRLTPAHPLQCYPVPPWVYPWNSGWNNAAAMAVGQCPSEVVYGLDNGNLRPVQLGATSLVAAPAFCTPNIPFPFVPASYWGCMPSWAVNAWNMPQIGSNGSVSLSSSTSISACSSNGSHTLGKHSRAASLQGEEKVEKCFWVPKTLRIDNPDEAAKSSIWATLGIEPDQNEPITKGGIFKAFPLKAEGNCHASDTTQVLQANPAALSRFQTFQERA